MLFSSDDDSWSLNTGHALGSDRTGYKDILEIENENIAQLLNACLDDLDAPTPWLRTPIAAIPKKGKPLDDPDSYQTIGKECHFLKLKTVLFHKRVYDAAERPGIFPRSQNGFRSGYNLPHKQQLIHLACND
ncbi:unnamed protein product [Peniophora sp. CBMAI 1063]|nr:unnamed protein product [Peniophora sp. CBMAI 1063]